MTITRMYHGTDADLAIHLGLCLTADPDVARDYATGNYLCRGDRRVHEVTVDLSDLIVVEVDDYDRDGDYAHGDDGYDGDADVIFYRDETESAHQHQTWRLVSERALAALHPITAHLIDL